MRLAQEPVYVSVSVPDLDPPHTFHSRPQWAVFMPLEIRTQISETLSRTKLEAIHPIPGVYLKHLIPTNCYEQQCHTAAQLFTTHQLKRLSKTRLALEEKGELIKRLTALNRS